MTKTQRSKLIKAFKAAQRDRLEEFKKAIQPGGELDKCVDLGGRIWVHTTEMEVDVVIGRKKKSKR